MQCRTCHEDVDPAFDLEECPACFWRRYVASLTPDERAVMDEFGRITAPVEED